MESVLDKEVLSKQLRNDLRLDSNRKILETEAFQTGAIIIALIEIREAIEEGLQALDHTGLEMAMMMIGCKESFDTFIETRIQSDKVLSAMLAKGQQGHPIAEEPQKEKAAKLALQVIRAANFGKVPENGEKPDGQPPEEKKSSVTLSHGDFGKIPSDSGIA